MNIRPEPAVHHRRGRRFIRGPFRAAVLVALAAAPLLAQYDPELQYQDRGDRHEGLRPKPVAGYDVALLSARVDYREESDGWPEKLRLRFYLPEPQEVFVTVRQLRPRSTYYWLDLQVCGQGVDALTLRVEGRACAREPRARAPLYEDA